MRLKVSTRSGSIYVFEQREDGWWLLGQQTSNVATWRSEHVPATEFPVVFHTPMPPIVGQVTWFDSDPTRGPRLPGGGKRTSPVVQVDAL